MRKKQEIIKEENIAMMKVWYDRHQVGMQQGIQTKRIPK